MYTHAVPAYASKLDLVAVAKFIKRVPSSNKYQYYMYNSPVN